MCQNSINELIMKYVSIIMKLEFYHTVVIILFSLLCNDLFHIKWPYFSNVYTSANSRLPPNFSNNDCTSFLKAWGNNQLRKT